MSEVRPLVLHIEVMWLVNKSPFEHIVTQI